MLYYNQKVKGGSAMNAYVVVSGYWDEYQIEKIFLDEKSALDYCEEMNKEGGNFDRDFRIEEHEVVTN